MKINSKSFAHKKLALSALAVVVLGVATVAALEVTKTTDFIKLDSSQPSAPTKAEKAEQLQAEQNAKKDFVESPDPASRPPSTETSPSIELSAKQESNGSVTVLTKLYSVADGMCTLTISNGIKTYTQNAEIIYQPDFSSCAGFSIPKEKLGTGEWVIKLSVNSDTTIEKTINFKVT